MLKVKVKKDSTKMRIVLVNHYILDLYRKKYTQCALKEGQLYIMTYD